MTTYTLADDPNGCPTIWDERHEAVATLDNVILLGPEYRNLPWAVLTRVLAPDEATVERLAMAICDDPTRHLQGCPVWAQRSQRHRDPCTCRWSNYARRVLAALATAPDPDGGKDEGVSR